MIFLKHFLQEKISSENYVILRKFRDKCKSLIKMISSILFVFNKQCSYEKPFRNKFLKKIKH